MDDKKLIEETLDGTYAFEGRLLHLRVDRVRLPDGGTAGREVVEHPGGVAVVAITDEDEVLLVRQFRYPYKEILTEIPAGKREPGEDPLTTGIRELAEETGATADRFEPLGKVYPTPGYCDEIIYIYLATGLHFADAHPDEDEFLDVIRMPLREAEERVMNGEFADAKTQIGILKAIARKQKGEV